METARPSHRGIMPQAIRSLRYSPMLRPSPTMARKDFGSNDGRRLSAMADLLYREPLKSEPIFRG
jgi:hypothetical protein